MKYFLIALLATTGVNANENHKPKPVTQAQHQSQEAEASAKATSSANSENTNTANGGMGGSGGDAQATGGQGGSSQSGSTLVNTYPQQVPAISQGSFAIQGCQVAGNAGGANSHGAGFLGFGFTPAECYRFMLAQAYQAVGQTQTACEVLAHTDTAKAAVRDGLLLPDCKPAPPVVPVVVAPPPIKDTVNHEELKEVEKRITEAATKK